MWPHLQFLHPERAAKMLVGEPPQTRLAAARCYCIEPYFGTFCPKEKNAGEQHETVPPRCYHYLAKNRGGRISILPPRFSRLESLANRALSQVYFPHISQLFLNAFDNRKRRRFRANKNTPHKAILSVPSAG